MKTIVLGITALLFALNIQAQIKNVKSEVIETTTTIKDSDGKKEIIKTEEVKEVQDIELIDADSKVLNKDIKESPIHVVEVTKVTEDGITKVIDVDRSAYYDFNGTKYKITNDEKGYTMYYPNGKKWAVLRKTNTNNYIYKNNRDTSVGYFDTDGNLRLETYNPKTDMITVTTYTLIKQ